MAKYNVSEVYKHIDGQIKKIYIYIYIYIYTDGVRGGVVS
jgi:hypothetical protein